MALHPDTVQTRARQLFQISVRERIDVGFEQWVAVEREEGVNVARIPGELALDVTGRRVLDAGDRFTALGERHVPWQQPVDVDAVADRVASVSFIAAMAVDDRARLLDEVRAAASEAPPPLALVYVTDVFCFGRVD